MMRSFMTVAAVMAVAAVVAMVVVVNRDCNN
jgi:hypothetical protein